MCTLLILFHVHKKIYCHKRVRSNLLPLIIANDHIQITGVDYELSQLIIRICMLVYAELIKEIYNLTPLAVLM